MYTHTHMCTPTQRKTDTHLRQRHADTHTQRRVDDANAVVIWFVALITISPAHLIRQGICTVRYSQFVCITMYSNCTNALIWVSSVAAGMSNQLALSEEVGCRGDQQTFSRLRYRVNRLCLTDCWLESAFCYRLQTHRHVNAIYMV